MQRHIEKLIFFLLAAAPFVLSAAEYCDTCPRDKHGRIERSVSAKTEFKREHSCPSTGKAKGACPGYVIDHVIALKRGGMDNPRNMQWQTISEAKAKDRWE